MSVHRDSLWSDQDRRDPRQFNRILDLAGLGPAFHVTGASAFVDRVVGPTQAVRVEAAGDRFQDGNSRTSVYGHYQFVTANKPGQWTALRPNVYWERYEDKSPLYFSPKAFVSVGNMWHTIREHPGWRVEAELNPKATWYDRRAGFAMHGLLDATRAVGPATIGGGGFVLYDQRSDYWAWRLAAHVGLRLGQ